MSLFDLFRRADGEGETPQGNTSPNILGGEADYDTLTALINSEGISSENAKNISTVIACIDRIAMSVASAPVKLIERKDGKISIKNDDYRVKMLNIDGHDTLSAFDQKTAIMRDYFLKKGGYIFIDKQGNTIRSLRYVKSDDISFMVNDDPIFRHAEAQCGGKQYQLYQFIKVLRHTDDGWKGKSIIDEHPLLLSVVLNALKFEKNLVETGGNKKGFLKSTKKLTQEAINSLKIAWKKLYSNNSENVMVLNDGLEFKEASNTSVEMQLNQNKMTNNAEICKIFGIPPAIIQGNATKEDRVSFLNYCLMPIFEQIQNELNRVLLLESEKGTLSFAFDTTELSKGDIETRYKAYREAVDAGWMQIEEVREHENFEPLGIKMLKLDLGDVLLDTDKNVLYVPNTGVTLNLDGEQTEEENATPPTPTPTALMRGYKSKKRRKGGSDE